MRGYPKEQLESKGRKLSKYKLCERCLLHWPKNGFTAQFQAPRDTGESKNTMKTKRDVVRRPIAVIHPFQQRAGLRHPSSERFIHFLVETAIESCLLEGADRVALGDLGDRVGTRDPSLSEPTAGLDQKLVMMTVAEAAASFGLAPNKLLATFDREMVPFEVELKPRRTATRDCRRSEPERAACGIPSARVLVESSGTT